MSNRVKECVMNCVLHNGWFIFFSLVAIILIVASWFVPPMAVIDSSVLAAVGEIFAFAALGTVIKAIDSGVDAKIQHKDTSLTIGDLNKDENS